MSNDRRVIVEAIPECLRLRPQWVVWRYYIRKDARIKKPIDVKSGQAASSSNPATWSSFDQALDAYHRNTRLAGIGYVFSADDPFCGVDLDDCRDPVTGELAPWATDIVKQLDSYSEVSPSATGVKIYTIAKKPGGLCSKAYETGKVEVFDRKRFFAVTGLRLDYVSPNIEPRQVQVEQVYKAVLGITGQEEIKPDCPSIAYSSTPSKLSDEEIVELASSQRRSGDKFRSLLNGDWKAHFYSASEADSSLVFKLAFFTKDAGQIDRIFRSSALMRPKWDERRGGETYGQMTIAKALSKVEGQYMPKQKRKAAKVGLSPVDGWEFKSDQTENAMAVEFIDANQRKLRYVPPWKKWLSWDGKRWKVDVDSGRTMRLTRRLVSDYWNQLPNFQSEKMQKKWADFCGWANRRTTIENIVALARSDARITIEHEQLNQNAYFLNVQNGTVDLCTGELRDHCQSDAITQLANVAFNPRARCPKWLAFIDLIFGDDKQAKRYVRALLGYSCSGDVGEHILPICYGSGANGKSTLWNAVVELLGDYAMLAPSKLLLGTSNEHDTVIASLYQRRLVAISEPEEGARLREARVKELTGDEHITARRMREDYWSFRRTHKFWLSTNHLPQIGGTDDGIWRRIKLIPFRVDLRKVTEPIPDYHKVLIREEGPGILNWLLDGFQDWLANGFIEPDSVVEETRLFRGGADELGGFITDCCDVSPELVASSSELFDAYRNWGGQQSQTRFSISMQSRFNCATRTSGRYRNKRVFEGCALSKVEEME